MFNRFKTIRNSLVNMNGFTLIELLITISIIGILVAISIFGLSGARQSARDARRKSDLETIRSGMEIYKADFDIYPASPLGSSLTGGGNTYITSVPVDPTTSTPYGYTRTSDYTYTLCAVLELPTGTNWCVSNP